MIQEVQGCPWCGTEPDMGDDLFLTTASGFIGVQVVCPNCLAAGPRKTGLALELEDITRLAIEAWGEKF